jgi:hypothetical protein
MVKVELEAAFWTASFDRSSINPPGFTSSADTEALGVGEEMEGVGGGTMVIAGGAWAFPPSFGLEGEAVFKPELPTTRSTRVLTRSMTS